MCCGSNPSPAPGTGFAQGRIEGKKLVHAIMLGPEECYKDEDGECLTFPSDTAAYKWWYANGQPGYVQAQWRQPARLVPEVVDE